MKRVIGQALFFFLFISSNVFAECKCKEPAQLPELPPENASFPDMRKAEKEIQDYFKSAREYRECLASCVKETDRNISFVSNEWNRIVESFNNKLKKQGE